MFFFLVKKISTVVVMMLMTKSLTQRRVRNIFYLWYYENFNLTAVPESWHPEMF